MRLLKALVSFIVGTVAGALGSKLFGPFGGVLGFIAGALAAWWGPVRRGARLYCGRPGGVVGGAADGVLRMINEQ